MAKCELAIECNDECQECCYFCRKKGDCINSCEYMSMPCDDLITENEIVTLDMAVPDVIHAITEVTVKIKQLEELSKDMKKCLVEAMEEHNCKSFENDQIKMVYVAPTTRSSIDSTRLKKELPDVAEKYTKTSKVSSSVRITVK